MVKIVEFGASFNPPCNHHLFIVQKLIEVFGKVVVIPCGTRSDKPSTATSSPLHRKKMTELIFSNIPGLEIDYYDLNNNIFTPTWMTDEGLKKKYPESEIWHTTGGDLILMGRNGNSEIQRIWHKGREIWKKLNWVIIDHPNCPIDPRDLPPNHQLVKMDAFFGRSSLVRRMIVRNESISSLVPPQIEEYIRKNDLYR